jgi:hypothetical protein
MFYRIEHESDGKGFVHSKAYFSYGKNEIFRDFYCKHANFPSPERENLIDDNNNLRGWYCAFRNKKEFKKAVSKTELNFFIGKGFKIYQIQPIYRDYDHLRIGKRQVIFKANAVLKTDITNKFI